MNAIILSIIFTGLAIAIIPMMFIMVVACKGSSIRPHNIPKGPEPPMTADEALQARIKFIKIDSAIRSHF